MNSDWQGTWKNPCTEPSFKTVEIVVAKQLAKCNIFSKVSGVVWASNKIVHGSEN